MNNENNKIKSVWTDISKVWSRIAGVIGAIGIVSTFIVKVFNTRPEITYSLFGCLGALLLIISFYVDKQIEYTHQKIVTSEQKARADFQKIMLEARDQTLGMKADSDKKINDLTDNLSTILDLAQETRRDTVRIQLIMVLKHQPENIDTILKLAEVYFVELHGDWFMTSEFINWAKAHNVAVPTNIYQAIDDNHKK